MRLTTAGSDSTFHAIRLARAFTGRDRIVKFEGAYHGVHDYAQVSTAPAGEAPFPAAQPDTAGIPGGVADLTLVAQWNDIDSLRAILEAHGPRSPRSSWSRSSASCRRGPASCTPCAS